MDSIVPWLVKLKERAHDEAILLAAYTMNKLPIEVSNLGVINSANMHSFTADLI